MERKNGAAPYQAGKAILLPILSGSCWDDNTDPSLKTNAGLLHCASAGNEHGLISANLDGRNLQNLEQYRTHSGFYKIVVPKDNVFNNVPGTWKSLTEGFFLFLEPLSPGRHDLHVTTSVSNVVQPSYNYAADLTYHLDVK